MTQILSGFQMIHLARVESTNNYAAKLLEAGSVAPPAVIMADEQFAGRGQRGANWHSQPGANLTFSLLLAGDLLPSEVFQLNMRAAVVLCQLIEPLLPHALVQIKWPNDVLVNRTKIAGILVENQLQKGRIHQSVMGVGLNVNQTSFGDITATSLVLLSGQEHDRITLLSTFLDRWKNVDIRPERLQQAYMSRLMGAQNFERYQIGDVQLQAKISAVDLDGVLKLEDSEGLLHQFRTKELRWIPD